MERRQGMISVIIPVYNAEQYLRETLDSIIGQSYKNREILLVENGSKDQSPQIIREYEEKYPEIHMLKGPQSGPGAGRNTGLQAANGEYIVFADADDYLPNADVFEHYIQIVKDLDADIVVGNYERLWKGRLLLAAGTESMAQSEQKTEDFYFKGFFSVGILSYVWGKLYRREFLEKNQITFEKLSYAEDKLFNMQCYVCGAKYAFTQEKVYVYRRNENSVSWKYHPDSVSDWLKIAALTKDWIKKNSEDMEFYKGLVQYTLFLPLFLTEKWSMKNMENRYRQ